MIRRHVLPLLLLGGLSVPAHAQTAGGADADSRFADPYYKARYCSYTATAFKDEQTAQGWGGIALDIARERGIAGDRLEELDDLAFDLAPLTGNEDDRLAYEQCRVRLALLRRQAQAAVSQTTISPVNAYAPARAAWYDRSAAAIQQDPAKRNEAMSNIRAWDAYCFVSGASLSTMMAENPAAFGLDPQKADHVKLAQAVQSETAKFKSQFEKDFREAERPQMQGFVDRQRENYGKGYLERKASEKDVVEFGKTQVFECSEGFGQLWASLTR